MTLEETFALNCLAPSEAHYHACAQDTLELLCRSGAVLCKLLTAAIPGSLDERAINEGIDVSAEEVQENFQLCHSCAQAQGCDVQGLTIEQLSSCEASAVAAFVLEVMRVSAGQALPAADRHWLMAPAAQPPPGTRDAALPRRGASTAAAKGEHGDTSNRSSGGGSSSGGGDGCGAGGSGVGSGVGACQHDTAHHTSANGDVGKGGCEPCAPQPGTAAARRAAAGLEQWALHLTGGGGEQPASTEGTAGEGSGAVASTGAGAGKITPLGPGRCSDGDPGEGDPLGVSVWELLAAHLLRHEDGGAAVHSEGCVPSEGRAMGRLPGADCPAAGTGSASAAPASGSTGEGSPQDPASSPKASAPTPCIGAAAGSHTIDGGARGDAGTGGGDAGLAHQGMDEEARWAAVAATLSRAIAPAQGAAPLPPLRAEHLRCRHAGLRSVLLAHTLLTHVRKRDGVVPTAAVTSIPAADSGSSGGGHAEEQQGLEGEGSSSGDVAHAADGLTLRQLSLDGAAAAAAVAAAVAQPPLASPAPPLPRTALRQTWSGGAGPRAARSMGSGGGGASAGDKGPADVLSEHNKLVAQMHQQREVRRQQRGGFSAGGGGSGGTAAGAGGLTVRVSAAAAAAADASGMLWGGDTEDMAGEGQEERVLRLWLNSLDPRLHVGSLFETEATTGWPLLQALDAIQPGCVPWHSAFRPPFKEKLRKILSVQNCNLVIAVCTRRLAMPPLVNIGGLDLALGHRRATLSLVFQMMRHHTGMLLGLVAPPPPPTTTQPLHPHEDLAPVSAANGTDPLAPGLLSPVRAPQPMPLPPPTLPERTPSQPQSPTHGPVAGAGATLRRYGTIGHSGQAAQHQTHNHHHHQRHHAPHVEVEKAVLSWANTKLTAAAMGTAGTASSAAAAGTQTAAAEAAAASSSLRPAAPFTPLASFSDSRLGEGRLLLQLLAAICPRAVNPLYVLPGKRPEERESNAKYLLSCARKVGCVIFLGWEDVVAARPNLLLLLMAALMVLDRKRTAAAAEAAQVGAAAAAACGSQAAAGKTAA